MRRGMVAKRKPVKADGSQGPSAKPTTLDVPLYPRSAQVLLEILERPDVAIDYGLHPQYVNIDIDNFRNHLRAHLQRVEIGQ